MTMQNLLVKYFSNHFSNLLERLLLCGIILTGILLLGILITLLYRYLSSGNMPTNKSNRNSSRDAFSQNPNSDPNQNHTPIFFGLPNPELESVNHPPEEDWETLAIRNFNQHFSSPNPSAYPKLQELSLTFEAELGETEVEQRELQQTEVEQIVVEQIEVEQTEAEHREVENRKIQQTELGQIEISLKLDLAKTYLQIEDAQNASQLLKEILKSQRASLAEKKSAELLLATI